ncbi:MAG: SusC/RagA family TonB-linked outer membrane protein [Bacteroidales bacterium]|nr:SusC/RagA family TonB-linked outer membrane protein [Bacteroidales bacterium]
MLVIITLQLTDAQTSRTVSGTVRDSEQQPLPGATINVVDTNIGVITDLNGNYKINIPETKTVLKISYIGYLSETIDVNNQNIINVNLVPDISSIEEVLVIGYGSAKKKDATGAVALVSEKDFQKGYIANPAQLIANKVPGVQITSGGSPGSKSTIRIRGGSSLNASNDPLIVIDGVPVKDADALSRLNPNDIASFSVLKDASAAAIYGSRGSNGVILVTTKKGSAGELKFTFSSQFTLSQVTKTEEVLTGDEYRALAQEAADFTGMDISRFNLGSANTNWQDEIYQDAVGMEYNFSMSGGYKNLPYRLSVAYMDKDGIVTTDKYKRLNGALNLSPDLFDKHLKINLNLKVSKEDSRWIDNRVIKSAITYNPTQPVYDESSNFGGYFEYYFVESNPGLLHGHFNPVGMLQQNKSEGETIAGVGNLQLDYKFHFLEDLRANVNLGYELGRSEYSKYVPETSFEYNFEQGMVQNASPSSEKDNVYLETYLNYSKDLSSVESKIDIMGGYSYYDFKSKNYRYPSFNVYGDTIPNTVPVYEYDIPQHTLISFYGRLNYQFKNKYILTATIRRDGSSRFSEQNRWGIFPSAALAWKINEENFMRNAANLSNLKLRIGYGVTGQQDGIGNYGYITTYTVGGVKNETYPFGDEWIQPVYPAAVDKNRKWEETTSYNAAIEWGFYKERISGSLDFYLKETTDLLNNVNIPLGSNFASNITRNIGTMENRGIEISASAVPISSKDLSWSVGFNFNYNENKITSLSFDDTNPDALYSGNILVSALNHSRNSYYVYHQVYDTKGNPIEDTMLDVNNDGLINHHDRYITQSSIPKFMMGFNTSLNYKKWSLDMAFHSNIGHYMFYATNDNLSSIYKFHGGETPRNLHVSYYDNGFKRTGHQFQYYSDHYLQNASFLKMDNANLSYSFGKVFKSFKTNATLDLNISVQNVFVITNYNGKDPEPKANWGLDYGTTYPVPRTFVTGLNLKF